MTAQTNSSETRRCSRGVAAVTASVLLASTATGTHVARAAPPIRTGADNRVPACASPERLMAFARERNPRIDPRFADIAQWYRYWGEAWHVRWDYAFFQMLLETNYLSFRRPNGDRGDVHEKQNNFAGIGATGNGVPGDRFPDVRTGVHAQIQHLVAYSGERVTKPVAPRTELKQDDIIEQSRRLRRAVTFGDLARRWAADRKYARSIDGVAGQFRDIYCTGTQAASAAGLPPPPRPAERDPRRAFAPPAHLGGPPLQKLAGPDTEQSETLPWSPPTEPAGGAPAPLSNNPPPQPATSAPKPSKPARTSKSKPPVTTIWSREGGLVKPADDPATETAAQPAATPAAAPQRSAPPARAPEAAAESETPGLPQFRITPLGGAGPSKLGGPVPALEPGSAPVAGLQAPPHGASALSAAPLGQPPCRVLTASYGGRKTLLVKALAGSETRYTALTVLDGFEKSMFDIYVRAAAPGGAELVGEYPSREAALADAHANCPEK